MTALLNDEVYEERFCELERTDLQGWRKRRMKRGADSLAPVVGLAEKNGNKKLAAEFRNLDELIGLAEVTESGKAGRTAQSSWLKCRTVEGMDPEKKLENVEENLGKTSDI